MSLYAIGDLHLSHSVNKPMDVFGGAWQGYVAKLEQGLSVLKDDDVVVLCGDLSWAMNLEEAEKDFSFLNGFSGKKIILKGNHDYWWSTSKKMYDFFEKNGYDNFHILHNNAFLYENTAICGTRGWFFEEDAPDGSHNQKIFNRELMRLETSLKEAEKLSPEKIIVFLHYPPVYKGYVCGEIVEILKRFNVERCFYGHLHGNSHRSAVQGKLDGIEYTLISADYIGFNPVKIL